MPRSAVIIAVALFAAAPACAARAQGFALTPGDLLGVSLTGQKSIVRIDPTTGARPQLFSLVQLENANGVDFQDDYLAVTPQGRLLLQGRPFATPSGPFEFFQLDPADLSVTRVSRFLEAAVNPQTPPGLRDPLGSAGDADRIAVLSDGKAVILNDRGDTLLRFDPLTAGLSIFRGAIGTALPTTLDTVTVTSTGLLVGDHLVIGQTPAEDRPLDTPIGQFPFATPSGKIIGFRPLDDSQDESELPEFVEIDPVTGGAESLGGFGTFLPEQVPQITAENFVLDDFVAVGDDLFFAGFRGLRVRRAGAQDPTTVLVPNTVALPNPTIDRLLVVPDFTPPSPGDFNGDGVVDVADFTVWRDNLRTDFFLSGNGDDSGASAGVVDVADYRLWRDHFSGIAAPPAAGPAPEPGAAFLTALGLSILACRRGR